MEFGDTGTGNGKELSGAVGGPATADGVSYQVLYAVHRGLELLERYISESGLQAGVSFIQMEPRLRGHTGLVRWDIQIVESARLPVTIEAKGNLSKDDVDDFCSRLTQHELQTTSFRFRLVYGRVAGSHLNELESLVRLAKEAENALRFQSLVDSEQRGNSSVLAILGRDAYLALRRIELEQISTPTLESLIKSTAQRVASGSNSIHLENLLFRCFAAAMTRRETILIRRLVESIRSDGIAFRVPCIDDLSRLPDAIRFVIDALRHCPHPLPITVAADASGLSAGMLCEQLEPLQAAGGLSTIDGKLSISPIVRTFSPGPASDQTVRVVEALLGYVKETNESDQIRNAMSLYQQVPGPSGELTLRAYEVLDKRVKKLGDKKLLLDFANSCLNKARNAPRTEAAARAAAKVLICGVSWVAQRVGRLEDAEMIGLKSLSDGERIGWTRNTAFCHKCLGRLKRLQAEGERNVRKQAKLLADSVSFLERSRELFQSGVDERGPLLDEVGDCWSLLGRTLLVQRKLEAAIHAAKQAREFLIDENNKDYFDLLILEGDLAVQRVAFIAAESKYQEVIDRHNLSDAEHSEIIARAWQHMGLCHYRSKRAPWRPLMEKAVAIWRSIGELYMPSVAIWEMYEMEREVPEDVAKELANSDPMTRVEFMRLRKCKLDNQGNRNLLANRSQWTIQQIRGLLSQARSSVQIHNRFWTFNA